GSTEHADGEIHSAQPVARYVRIPDFARAGQVVQGDVVRAQIQLRTGGHIDIRRAAGPICGDVVVVDASGHNIDLAGEVVDSGRRVADSEYASAGLVDRSSSRKRL